MIRCNFLLAIFGQDLELFAKHAKRSTINADDVKLLARRSPTVVSLQTTSQCSFKFGDFLICYFIDQEV